MKTSARFNDALVFAAQLHVDQKRKASGTPYIGHLLSVAGIVIEHSGTEDEAIAALLHDAVEDQGGLPTLDRIRAKFGDAVAEIVMGCTDSTETDPTKKPPWDGLPRLLKTKPSLPPSSRNTAKRSSQSRNRRPLHPGGESVIREPLKVYERNRQCIRMKV
jgi:hypothetical protein